MIVRTCLLISDDPDDHIEFSEALYEISDDAVVITVSDIHKAVDLLKVKRCLPEFIFVQLGMLSAFEPDVFFKALEGDMELANVKVIAFGEPAELSSSARIAAFLNSDMNYSELKEALRGIL